MSFTSDNFLSTPLSFVCVQLSVIMVNGVITGQASAGQLEVRITGSPFAQNVYCTFHQWVSTVGRNMSPKYILAHTSYHFFHRVRHDNF
jgi:hypothetical protein